MRVSVMLHLPALVITRQIDKVFRIAAKDQPGRPRAVRRRLAGDGRLLPDQQPDHAGRSEADLVKQVGDVVPTIIDYERQGPRVPGRAKARRTCTTA